MVSSVPARSAWADAPANNTTPPPLSRAKSDELGGITTLAIEANAVSTVTRPLTLPTRPPPCSDRHTRADIIVSRVDTEADKRLDQVGHPELKGKLAIANAKLAYQHYLEAFAGERWQFLEGKGATKQRCLWASTSTKNPEYRDVMYVEELIGPETVNTMPLETIRAFQDHGEVRGDTVLEGIDEARALLQRLADAGVDYNDVTDTLEAEGVQKFADSFDEIVESIRVKRSSLAAA